MRSITKLIEQIRRQTENEEYDNTFIGINDDEIVQYINDAQYNLQALIVQQHPRAFINEVIIPVVPGKEEYELPTDCFLGNKVHNVEYSPTGNLEDYYVLEQETIKSRVSGVNGSPTKYILMTKKILLAPQPSGSGALRINYVQRLRELDRRQARLASKSFNISPNGSILLEFNETKLTTGLQSLKDHEYLCIVDKSGKDIARNLLIDEDYNNNSGAFKVINTTSNSINIDALYNPLYVVGGLDTTTHAEVDISVERYLISYCAYKVLKRDSSVDSAEAIAELTAMAQEIVKSYSLITDDVQFIPQLNSWEDWSV